MHHIVQILLPIYDNQGAKFESGVYDLVRSELIERFGGLTAYTRSPAVGLWRPVFGSLAEDQGESAVGIVLSGAGHDGTVGIRAIKERGGLTMAQGSDGTEPRFKDMPESAMPVGLSISSCPRTRWESGSPPSPAEARSSANA